MAEISTVIVEVRGLGLRLTSLAVALFVAASLAAGLQAQEAKPIVSDEPLTAEQLAVYQVVLHGWMEREVSVINLSIQTIPLPMSGALDASECAKGLDLEPASPNLVHRFRAQDLSQLGSAKIGLVDPERHEREIAENDPGKAIQTGKSVDEAVSNGFGHGMVTLSEIRFDKEHKHAVVSYSFHCGGLCGNGGAVVLEKVDGAWRRKSNCSNWIS
jgi:hypothetical protein